ncbi:MAG: DUF1963 domain-containing protein [Paludibacteraceae bacterium]|nr:DUF1963 domain-containing protein [Paludibacteraceae bacterium]
MAIKLIFPNEPADPAPGTSRMWGMPDLPESTPYPETVVSDEDGEYADPMTLICQINCQDIATFDTENLLPHKGLLSFFAVIDYYLGMEDTDADGYNGIGEWTKDMFRVIWSEDTQNLHRHTIEDEDGNPYGLKAEKIVFSGNARHDDGFRLLGKPFYEEVAEQTDAKLISLLQLDESERWNLRFYDCGMLNFLISKEDLLARRFDNVRCYMHSF